MGATQWLSWFDDILADLPGCGQPLAKLHIRAAAIDFCERSLAWRADLDPIDAIEDEGTYDLDPDTGTVVVRVLELWYDGKRINAKSADDLACLYANWTTEAGTPLYYTQETPSDSVILVPMPNADLAGALTGKVAIKPSQASTGIDSSIFEKWREAIAHGAKARLFALKKKPWSDKELAAYHQGVFDSKVATAALAASKGFTGAPKRVKAHFK